MRAATDEDARGLLDETNILLAELGRLAGKPVVILIDGLDKKPSLTQLYRSLERDDLLVDLDAAVVLSGPIHLRHAPRSSGLLPGHFEPHPLHNIPVVTHDAGSVVAHKAGIDALTAVYRRRADLTPALAVLFDDRDLRRLARASSGIVRDLLVLTTYAVRAMVRDGRERVSGADVDVAIRTRKQTLQLHLDAARIALLCEVLRTELLPSSSVASDLLFSNYIACYPNDDLWYRPHEALVDYVTERCV